MKIVSDIILIAFIEIFVENTIFYKALGSSTMIISSKNKKYLIGLTLCITYFTTVSSGLSYFVDKIFSNYDMNYLYTPIVYVVIIGIVYIITLLLLWKFFNRIFNKVKKFVHLSAFNCTVFGALLINSLTNKTFSDYIIFGFGTGIGFMLAAYLLSIVYERLNSEEIPKSFRGYPLILIYIGILSMAFYGFTGNQINL